MTVIFRADASSQMGTGHVMRCVALAMAAKNKGWRVRFVGRIEITELRSRLNDMAIDLTPLERTYPDPTDLAQTIQLLSDEWESPFQTPWLVLDGYQFDEQYHRTVREAGHRLLVVDDYNHLERYDCEALLNQNIGADRLEYATADYTMKLFGPRFTLIRSEFLAFSDKKRETPEKAGHILVTMGGADPHNATAKILEGLNLLNAPELEVKVVVGPANRYLPEIEQIVKKAPFSVEVLLNVRDMAPVMVWADLAVTAASVTSLEFAYMGVPMAAVVLAENQKGLAAGLIERGAAIDLGFYEDLTPRKISQTISSLMVYRPGRQALSDTGQALVDGQGAARVMAVLGRDRLHLRKAESRDCRRLWEWANDPVVRSHSFNVAPIPWEDHQAWFNDRLNDQDSCIYLAELSDREPVGTIRFQAMFDHTVVSVTVNGDFRGLGFGAEIIRKGCLKYRGSHADLPIRALIKPDNPASMHAFTKAGFQTDGEIENAGERATAMTFQAD